MRISILLAFAFSLTAMGELHGAIVIHTTRAAFDTAAGATSTEGFETTPTGNLALPFTFPTGLTAGLASGTVNVYVAAPPLDFGFTNTTPGGSKVLAYGNTGNSGVYDVSFSASGQPMTAVGFDISGYQPASNSPNGFQATFLNGTTVVESIFVPDTTDFSLHFRGFTNNVPFTEARFNIRPLTPTAADFSAFDQVSFKVVPDPATTALASLTAMALAVRRIRRSLAIARSKP